LVHLIDRRVQGKNKSAPNRERFLRRYKGQIKQAVARAIKGRSITDINGGEHINIPVKDLGEPSFGHAHGGVWETVQPGNQEYLKGDKIARPQGGGGVKVRVRRVIVMICRKMNLVFNSVAKNF